MLTLTDFKPGDRVETLGDETFRAGLLATVVGPHAEPSLVNVVWDEPDWRCANVGWFPERFKLAEPEGIAWLDRQNPSEVRRVSATGGEKGQKPERYDLLPREGLDEIARVFGFGSQKYEDHNWRKGYPWSLNYAALMRHLTAFWDGEDTDPESGLSHLGHAGFHVLAMITGMKDHPEYDDRFKGDV